MGSLYLFHMLHNFHDYWFAVLCVLYSALHITTLHVWYHRATIRHIALHSRNQLRLRMWKKYLSWLVYKFRFQSAQTSHQRGLRFPRWWWNLRLLRRFRWGCRLRSRWKCPTAFALVCWRMRMKSLRFQSFQMLSVCRSDLGHLGPSVHMSLAPPGPGSGHSRKVQQHLQGRRQTRAKDQTKHGSKHGLNLVTQAV